MRFFVFVIVIVFLNVLANGSTPVTKALQSRVHSLFSSIYQRAVPLPNKDILPLICVSEPYYSLKNLRWHSEDSNYVTVDCSVTSEMKSHTEDCAISVAEAGRHLAILGSTALALDRAESKKNFYLIQRAILTRSSVSQKTRHDKGDIFKGIASVISQKRSKAKVSAELLDSSDKPIFSADFTYLCLSEPTFNALFSSNAMVTEDSLHNTIYTKLVPVKVEKYDATSIHASCLIFPKNCVGHFRGVPALPVALIGGVFMDTINEHLRLLYGDVNMYVELADISASKLLFATPKGLVVRMFGRQTNISEDGLIDYIVELFEDDDPIPFVTCLTKVRKS